MNDAELQRLIARMVEFALASFGVPKRSHQIAYHKTNSTDNTEVWKDFWAENHSSHHFPSEPHICPSCLLQKNDFVGGHVVINGKTCIVPVCRECNSKYKGDEADEHAFYVRNEDVLRLSDTAYD